jgi:hypothetical protein
MRGKLTPFIVSLALLAGCGPGHGLNLGRVSGKVSYRGEPIRYGFVTFQPDASKGTDGPPAMSTIAKDGSYALTTQDADDGAMVGFHKVSVIALDPEPVAGADAPEPKDAPKEFMAAKGARPKPTPRAKSASAGPTFKSRSGKQYRILGPEKLGNPETSGIAVEVKSGRNSIDLDIGEDGSVSLK